MIAGVHIAVFTLFHPEELEVRPIKANVVVVEHDGSKEILEGSHSIRLRGAARVAGRNGSNVAFVLAVPDRIHREFYGRLEIRKQENELLAIVTMDVETAVASIVAAEGSVGMPFEAAKAQAVVARSFLEAAHGRHVGYDFCDTTHCQYLRDVPSPRSFATRATTETRGLTVMYQGHTLATLYSANCGGHTITLEQARWNAMEYPYFAVECPVRGKPSGHRIGMCQLGAQEMANHGMLFREILSRYFPATVLTGVSADTGVHVGM